MLDGTTTRYDDDATCAMGLADFEALGLDPVAGPGTFLVGVDVAALKAVLTFASEDSTRYNLCGVLVEVDAAAKLLRLVATDGHALAVVERTVDDPAIFAAMGERDRSAFILSSDAVTQAIKCAGRSRLPVLLEIGIATDGSAGCAAILAFQARITSCTVDGVFPDWRQVVPAKSEEASTELFAVNVELFARCGALAKMLGKGAGVRVQSNGALKPIRVDAGHGVYAAIMPMRL